MSDLIPERQELPPESAAPGTAFDPSRPNVARLYDYLLDEDRPAQLIGELVDALPPGSYVFIHHLLDGADPATEQLQGQMLKALGGSSSARCQRSVPSLATCNWSTRAWSRSLHGAPTQAR